jgi:DNA repair exonuclease SbcCD nuclease subunit
MRFIHTSDWQLGKPFGRMPEDVRVSLQEARLDAIDRVAALARRQDAQTVLVAGDVFDSSEPGDRVFRQALSRMRGAPEVRWYLLPGNHDPARVDGLWSRLVSEAPSNVIACVAQEPIEISDRVWLLPAPLAHKRTLEDPTAWYKSAETPAGSLRIGLAHGSITTFGGSDEAPNLIAPDRARTSRLDYLALGDWHGRRTIDRVTQYSGTPETDDFGQEVSGVALVVDLSRTGEPPRVEEHRIGRFVWVDETWQLSAAPDLEDRLARLAPGCPRRDLVLRLRLSGLLTLAERIQVIERLETELANDVRWLDLHTDELIARPTDHDLADIDANGVLRQAADRLRILAAEGGPESKRARAALERLYIEQRKAQRVQEA